MLHGSNWKSNVPFVRMYVEHLKLWRSAFRCTVMSPTQNRLPRSITLMAMDLMALAMYTQRSLYIVFHGNFNVRVICGDAVSAVPDVQQLSAVCFPDKIIVIEFIDHNSFPRPGTGSNSELKTHPRKSLFKRPRPPSTGGKGKQQATLKDNPNKQMRGWRQGSCQYGAFVMYMCLTWGQYCCNQPKKK